MSSPPDHSPTSTHPDAAPPSHHSNDTVDSALVDPPIRIVRPLSFSLQRRASLPILSSHGRLSLSGHSSKPSTPPPGPVNEEEEEALEESERNERVGELRSLRIPPRWKGLRPSQSVPVSLGAGGTQAPSPLPPPDPNANAVNELANLAIDAMRSTVLRRLRGEDATELGPTIEDPMMESMNYDNYTDVVNESQIENSIYAKRHEVALLGLRICVTMVIAITTALLMYVVSSSYHWMFAQRVSAVMTLITSGQNASAYFQWVGISLLFTTFAAVIVVFFAPAARGSGLSYALAYLNGTNCLQYFTFRVVVIKAAMLCFTVAGGLTLGAEAPFVFLGAGIAILLSKSLDKLPMFSTQGSYTKILRSIKEERVFMACGVAAGLAVGFSAPIAGILFALEGATAFLTVPVTLRIFSCSMFAVLAYGVASNGFSSAIQSTNLIVILTDTNAMNTTDADGQEYAWQVPEIFAFTFLAIIGGLLGAGAVRMNLSVTKWRFQYMKGTFVRNVAEVMLITLITSTAWFVLPFIFGCRPTPAFCSYENSRCQQVMCASGTYSEVGSLVYSPIDIIARNLFDRSVSITEEYDPWPLASYGLLYILFVTWSYGSYVPGGLFVPSVIVGAVYGRVVGNIGQRYFASYINPGIYSLLGAAGMLGGFTRLALPVVVMLIEMTGDATYLLPIMYIATLAKLLADLIEPPLYPQHMALEGVPTLGDVLKPQVARKTAADLMNTRCYTMRGIERLGHILFVLTRSKGILIPLVDEESHFVGWISRNAVVHAIKYAKVKVDRKGKGRARNEPKADVISDVESDAAREYILRVSNPSLYEHGRVEPTESNPNGLLLSSSTEAILEAQSEYIDWSDTKDSASSLLSLGFDSRLYHDLVNLYPYSDTGAYTCRESTSAKRVAALFRRVGVSHVAVCDERMIFKGVITRRIMVGGLKPDLGMDSRRSSVWRREEEEEEKRMMEEDEDDDDSKKNTGSSSAGGPSYQSSKKDDEEKVNEEMIRQREVLEKEREIREREEKERIQREVAEAAARERKAREEEERRVAEEERRRKAIEKERERERQEAERRERENREKEHREKEQREKEQREKELREKELREKEQKVKDERDSKNLSVSIPSSTSPPLSARSIASSTAPVGVRTPERKDSKNEKSPPMTSPSTSPLIVPSFPMSPKSGSMSALFMPLSTAELAAREAVAARAKAKKDAITQKLGEMK